MGVKERRAQEKEALKEMILNSAMEMVSKKGLEALTIRGIAERIQYSPSIVYEYFDSKELICRQLCTLFCDRTLSALKKVPVNKDPDQYLLSLIRANVEFLRKNPQGIELLTHVCFGPDQSQIPKSFIEKEDLFIAALKQCNCKNLTDKKTFDDALDIIRSLHVGMLILSRYQSSAAGLQRISSSLENGIFTLLKGWRV